MPDSLCHGKGTASHIMYICAMDCCRLLSLAFLPCGGRPPRGTVQVIGRKSVLARNHRRCASYVEKGRRPIFTRKIRVQAGSSGTNREDRFGVDWLVSPVGSRFCAALFLRSNTAQIWVSSDCKTPWLDSHPGPRNTMEMEDRTPLWHNNQREWPGSVLGRA